MYDPKVKCCDAAGTSSNVIKREYDKRGILGGPNRVPQRLVTLRSHTVSLVPSLHGTLNIQRHGRRCFWT